MRCKIALCGVRDTHRKQVKEGRDGGGASEVETYIIVTSARGRMLLGSLMKTAVTGEGVGGREGVSVSSAGSSAVVAGGGANSSE